MWAAGYAELAGQHEYSGFEACKFGSAFEMLQRRFWSMRKLSPNGHNEGWCAVLNVLIGFTRVHAPCIYCFTLLQVGVSPENGPEVVERAARALGMPADTVFRLRLPEGNPHQLSTPPACAQCLLPGVAVLVPHGSWCSAHRRSRLHWSSVCTAWILLQRSEVGVYGSAMVPSRMP